jgi:hypothetical protein
LTKVTVAGSGDCVGDGAGAGDYKKEIIFISYMK